MKTLGYYNGTIDEIDKVMIPMNDRVHWFGDGVYDAGPCRNYHIFALDEHLDRLYNSAGLLRIKIPLSKRSSPICCPVWSGRWTPEISLSTSR